MLAYQNVDAHSSFTCSFCFQNAQNTEHFAITNQTVLYFGRYYSKEKDLPADLRPQAMERNHGLRARCIRALYFLSPVLVERVRLHGPFESDAHTLVGYRCLLAWHQPAQGKWHFCFKLQRLSPLYQPSTNRHTRCEDIRNGYNNIYYNPEEGCCVLQVSFRSWEII